VPPADKTDGAAVNVSGLQGVKTFEISGSYSGTYSILGSHDGNLYFPVAFFNSGGSSQTVRKTLEVVANFLKVHREAPQSGLVTVNIAARATTACASSTQGGLNNFFTLATLPPGANGPQPALDLFALVAATGMDVSNVACGGSFTGQISVEGSLDGVNFSPLGGFLSSQAQRGSGPGQSMFDPIVVGQVIRYIRANVLPSTVISTPTSLTMGGPQNCTCPGGGGGCAPVGLHTDGTSGSFTLTGASVTPIILGTAPYNFSCTGDAHVQLAGTVDSQSAGGAGTFVFPDYGIFIVTVVPPAASLFSIILPDVQMVTSRPHDGLFHTFTNNNTEVNPAGPRTIVFAVAPDSTGTDITVPATYNYKNFILNATGV